MNKLAAVPIVIESSKLQSLCPMCKLGIIRSKIVGGTTAQCSKCNQRYVIREESDAKKT